MEQIQFILLFMWENFLNVWPYLLLTIPIAVAVNLSGASKYIHRAFNFSPLVAIILATAVGAFSPFCSCTVIPIVAALLISGVPLAPVMAFWIASPSMDPEIFFLSVGVLGWELALWRFMGTLILSLGAGFLTHFIMQRHWKDTNILRETQVMSVPSMRTMVQDSWRWVRQRTMRPAPTATGSVSTPTIEGQTLSPSPTIALASIPVTVPINGSTESPASSPGTSSGNTTGNISASSCCAPTPSSSANSCGCSATVDTADSTAESCCGSDTAEQETLWPRLRRETWSATRMVVQFMALAFLLEALILLFVPQEMIISLLGEQNGWAIPLAALLGVPVYTSNLTALPLIGGLLAQGMDPGAGLAFLIAGPTTTLPAMAAVWGLVKLRIFALYVSCALFGAMALGLVYAIFAG